MEHVIRPALPQDLPELLKLISEHAAYEKASFDPEGKMQGLSEAIFSTPARLFCEVVEKDAGLVGYFSYTYDFSTWDAREFMYMNCLFLREEARGLGTGRRVLLKLQEIARQKGCKNIQWQTPEFNDPAIRFYKRNGAHALAKMRFTFNL
jgi:GNAT superfamily N-acetyltransferase